MPRRPSSSAARRSSCIIIAAVVRDRSRPRIHKLPAASAVSKPAAAWASPASSSRTVRTAASRAATRSAFFAAGAFLVADCAQPVDRGEGQRRPDAPGQRADLPLGRAAEIPVSQERVQLVTERRDYRVVAGLDALE